MKGHKAERRIASPAMQAIAPRITDILCNGLWAFFLCMLAIAAVVIVLKVDRLPYLVENFHADAYDTILSVKYFRDYGPFGNVPYAAGPYSLFGNFPILFAALGAAIDLVLDNPSLSASVLYWLTDIAIFILLWTKFLKHCDWKIRLLMSVFLVANIVFGNLFPLGFRKRQSLAILLGMGMFLTENTILGGAIAFLTLLAQPFTGAAMTALKIAEFAEKKRLRDIILMGIPFVFAYPFYANLLPYSPLEPQMLGCGYVTPPNLLFFATVALACLAFFVMNREKAGLVGLVSAALLLARPMVTFVFLSIKDILQPDMMERFLSMVTLSCPETFAAVAAFGMILTIYRRKAELPKAAMVLILLFAIYEISYITGIMLAETSVGPAYDAIASILEDADLHTLKTLEVLPLEYSGGVHYKPMMTLFSLQAYCRLHGSNITFLDEFDMPPQLSKGRSNIPMAALPQAIYDKDLERCRNLTGELKSDGVDGLLYVLSADQIYKNSSGQETFSNRSFLDGCGIVEMLNVSNLSTAMVLYRIR